MKLLGLVAGTLILVAAILVTAAAQADSPVGVRELKLADPARPLSGLFWYPARAAGPATLVGDTRVFLGNPALHGAEIAAGTFPLVLLSHGLGGNALNQGWLAASLAGHGMIVVAVNHPGSTTGDVTPHAAMMVWNRPGDIARAITAMEADPELGRHIDRHRIAAIGHSLGGWTALALAGLRLDRDRMAAYCDRQPDEGCTDLRQADLRSLPRDRFDGSDRDARVGAVVAMAPGLSPAMRPESLAAIGVPVMIVAGARDRTIPVAHMRQLASQLPADGVYVELPEAGHFDFLPACKPAGAALLREDGDDPVCDGAADRTRLHAAIADRIDRFLDAAWSAGR